MRTDRGCRLKLTIAICAFALASTPRPLVFAGPQSGSIEWFNRADADTNSPNGAFSSISNDGSTAFGFSYVGYVGQDYRGYQPFLWHANGSVLNVDLPDEYGGISGGFSAQQDKPAINGDGTSFCATNQENCGNAFIWRQATGNPFTLGTATGVVGGNIYTYANSIATAMSSDGLRVGATVDNGCGSQDQTAAIWTANSSADSTHGNWSVIGNSFNVYQSYVYGLSADGTKVVGTLFPVYGDPGMAYIWSAAGGLVTIPGPDQSHLSTGFGISGDGTVAIGIASPAQPVNGESGSTGFRWTSAGGMRFLLNSAANPGNYAGAALINPEAANTDGSVIVGNYGVNPYFASVWDNPHQSCDLKEVLAAAGLDVETAVLGNATGVSGDGKTIVGWGFPSGRGQQAAFVVRLPKAWIDGKPLLNFQRFPDSADFITNFVGVLQESDRLQSWQDTSPQPTSPYRFTPSTPRMFFRARLPDGGGLTAPSRRIEAEPQKISSGRSVSAK